MLSRVCLCTVSQIPCQAEAKNGWYYQWSSQCWIQCTQKTKRLFFFSQNDNTGSFLIKISYGNRDLLSLCFDLFQIEYSLIHQNKQKTIQAQTKPYDYRAINIQIFTYRQRFNDIVQRHSFSYLTQNPIWLHILGW